MEALDRLDELISSSSRGLDGLDEWNEDVNAAKELIDERIAKIKGLVDMYYEIRGGDKIVLKRNRRTTHSDTIRKSALRKMEE